MQILALNNINNNFKINFSSKVKRVIQGTVPEELKTKVDMFERTNGKQDKLLGEGTQASAYRLTGTDCVIKKAKYNMPQTEDGCFGDEAESLGRIPSELKHCQSLIGNIQTEDGNFYLLSSYVPGKIPDGKEVKWNRKNLSSLLNTLGDLDTNRIYHGDVSKCNCLIDDNDEVNIIDFQYSEPFEISGEENHALNAMKYKVPYFCAPSNAQMFEESNFGTYLYSISQDEAKDLFKAYLEEKSLYHEKRANSLEQSGARYEMVEYERLLAKYLKNPDDDIIKMEAMKLQILQNHRSIISAEDINKQEDLYNVISTVPYYLDTISNSQNMINYTHEQILTEGDPERKKLFEYENEYAYFWRSMMKNELDGRHNNSSAYSWILRNAAKKPLNENDDILASFINTSNIEHREIPDILGKLTQDYENYGFNSQNENDLTYGVKGIINSLQNSENYSISKKSNIKEAIEKLHSVKNSAMEDLKATYEYCSENKKSKAVFYSIRALYEVSIAKEFARALSEDDRVDTNIKGQIANDIFKLERIANDTEGFTNELYKQAFYDACGDYSIQ